MTTLHTAAYYKQYTKFTDYIKTSEITMIYQPPDQPQPHKTLIFMKTYFNIFV